MMRDPRYAPWLSIADDLEALNGFVFSNTGPFSHLRDEPFGSTGLEAARWIRNKCATGRWYWWDKTTISGIARTPLQSFQHVINDSNGLYEEMESGREFIKRIQRIKERIKKVDE